MLRLTVSGFIVATEMEVGRKENFVMLVHITCLIYIFGVRTDQFRVGASTRRHQNLVT